MTDDAADSDETDVAADDEDTNPVAEIAERASNDPFCETVGIDLASVHPGYAETMLTVEERHLNFHGTPHGGAVYALADAAFAAASNTGSKTAVALETNISYFAAVDVGETLRAVAEETHLGGRTAAYDVRVTDETGDPVATFRGRVYRFDD
ncbi:hydroxyphenylacetyl-CoA thioesterase PaaI [Salinigranum salinum]|uniref:hydroxyphenylacetyl-CoA thioesterase PaaI n=1 Tax=Salinigranum salinum TaxID=1364937 RepID=UPI001260C5A6|nr:hydroxyphenylacetyl-CoA thioesterase PaaI [Salinigranum salinum]